MIIVSAYIFAALGYVVGDMPAPISGAYMQIEIQPVVKPE